MVGKFPVVRDRAHKRDVAESSIIIEYLERFYAKERPLIPKDWEEALEVRLWDRVFDNYVHLPMQQIVADRIGGSKGDTTQYRSTIRTAYAMIDARMASRSWACGESFSLADCAAAPALFYAHTLEPFAATDKHLSEYFERLIARPSVRRVLDEAKPYFQYYPFKEALPKRFL